MTSTVINQLETLTILYQRFDHVPVFTRDKSHLLPAMPGIKNKNLFHRERKGKQYFMIIMTQDKQVPIQEIAEKRGEKSLSFAPSERLKKTLNIKPGCVGILALLNDKRNKTKQKFLSTKTSWMSNISNPIQASKRLLFHSRQKSSQNSSKALATTYKPFI